MDKIYCLMVDGGSLSDEVCTALFIAAQEMMDRRERKLHMSAIEHGFRGYMTTEYKYGMMGSVGGFTFTAQFDFEGRDHNVSFIARSIKKLDELENAKWVRTPLFPITSGSVHNN